MNTPRFINLAEQAIQRGINQLSLNHHLTVNFYHLDDDVDGMILRGKVEVKSNSGHQHFINVNWQRGWGLSMGNFLGRHKPITPQALLEEFYLDLLEKMATK